MCTLRVCIRVIDWTLLRLRPVPNNPFKLRASLSSRHRENFVGRLTLNPPITQWWEISNTAGGQGGLKLIQPGRSGLDLKISLLYKVRFLKKLVWAGDQSVFFFLLSGKWQCDWFVETCRFLLSSHLHYPVEHCGVRDVCLLLPSGACSPSHSCASPSQHHLCSPHLAWRYHQISPACLNVHSLSLPLALSSLPSHHALLKEVHSPLPSHSHLMVPLAASLTLWSNQCLCSSVWTSHTKKSKFSPFSLCLVLFSFCPRNEGAPTHHCCQPVGSHRATEGQWRPSLFAGVWGKSLALKVDQCLWLFYLGGNLVSLSFDSVHVFTEIMKVSARRHGSVIFTALFPIAQWKISYINCSEVLLHMTSR